MLMTMFYFIIALLLLVVVHEYGHFLVARLCGVKVLKFSFGFGRVLFCCRDRKGTEYVWSILPLGGYVKMLDEEEGEVKASERHLAFNNKSLKTRVAVVLAGPLFNFLFAFLALWLALLVGMYSIAPIIASVKLNSPASLAGFKAQEEIISFNQKPVSSWRDFQYGALPLIGSNESVPVVVKALKGGQTRTLRLAFSSLQPDSKKPDLLKSLGITPFIPTIPPIVGEVVADSPAKKAGFQVSDRIISMNGKSVDDWLDFVEFVRDNPGTSLVVEISRNQQIMKITVVIDSKKEGNQKTGFLGLRSQQVDWPKKWLRFHHQNPVAALGTAFTQTIELTQTTFSLIGRFITGKLALQNLSGPVGIAQGAGESASHGLASYLFFLALVSISLGVLNLLPIPMLDGGHLLFYFIEFLKGKPLSITAKSIGFYLGFVFLIAIMVLALHNDISRLLG